MKMANDKRSKEPGGTRLGGQRGLLHGPQAERPEGHEGINWADIWGTTFPAKVTANECPRPGEGG